MKNKENPVISYFHGGIKNTDRVISVAFSKMIEQVKSNKNWEKKILHVRLVLNKYGKGTEYKEAKRQLHYFMPCGSFKKRSKQGLEAVNGLLQGDIDNLTPEELERARQLLIKDQHTLGLFTSPSGLGLKFFIRINNQNNNALPVQAVLHYYKSNYDLELDPSTLNLYQACYISFDPEALINLSANIFTYELEDKKDRLHGGRAINNSSSNNQQSLNYCKMVITLEAKEILVAGQGNGCYQLNRAAFKAGTYENIGLVREMALEAFKIAFCNRKHSKHSEYEFNRVFQKGWDAGIKQPRNKK